ncbi:MAG TPA: nitrate transporter, partial [Reyranella sp.]|nr:nitrate transporter [Reyranella sp.]
PDRLQAALRALLRAAEFCDSPANASKVADILARETYLGLPAGVIATSLPSTSPRSHADRSVFFANTATFPWLSQAQWFLGEMRRWGYLDTSVDPQKIATIFRPDLYAAAAISLGLAVPTDTAKSEGKHDGSWRLPARPAPIDMGPDRFMDGAKFDPALHKPLSDA